MATALLSRCPLQHWGKVAHFLLGQRPLLLEGWSTPLVLKWPALTILEFAPALALEVLWAQDWSSDKGLRAIPLPRTCGRLLLGSCHVTLPLLAKALVLLATGLELVKRRYSHPFPWLLLTSLATLSLRFFQQLAALAFALWFLLSTFSLIT